MNDRRATMASLLQDYADSDLTIAQFCGHHRVSVATFYYWKKKLGASVTHPTELPASTASGFLNLAPRPAVVASDIQVRLPGGLEVELRGGSPAQLAELLHTLDARYRA